jgi:hypothetical protein
MMAHHPQLGHGLPILKRRRDACRKDGNMTVCIAALIPWMYDEQLGMAVITASDRMLTAGDIQYEPTNFKVSFLSDTVMLMVAEDMTVQTEALIAI